MCLRYAQLCVETDAKAPSRVDENAERIICNWWVTHSREMVQPILEKVARRRKKKALPAAGQIGGLSSSVLDIIQAVPSAPNRKCSSTPTQTAELSVDKLLKEAAFESTSGHDSDTESDVPVKVTQSAGASKRKRCSKAEVRKRTKMDMATEVRHFISCLGIYSHD